MLWELWGLGLESASCNDSDNGNECTNLAFSHLFLALGFCLVYEVTYKVIGTNIVYWYVQTKKEESWVRHYSALSAAKISFERLMFRGNSIIMSGIDAPLILRILSHVDDVPIKSKISVLQERCLCRDSIDSRALAMSVQEISCKPNILSENLSTLLYFLVPFPPSLTRRWQPSCLQSPPRHRQLTPDIDKDPKKIAGL